MPASWLPFTGCDGGGHQLLVTRLMAYLAKYLEPQGVADTLLSSPADITWGQDPRNAEDLVQPDLFVVGRGQSIGKWRDVSSLELAVEIVSPPQPAPTGWSNAGPTSAMASPPIGWWIRTPN